MRRVQRNKNIIEPLENISRQRAFGNSLFYVLFIHNHAICLQCMTLFVKLGPQYLFHFGKTYLVELLKRNRCERSLPLVCCDQKLREAARKGGFSTLPVKIGQGEV